MAPADDAGLNIVHYDYSSLMLLIILTGIPLCLGMYMYMYMYALVGVMVYTITGLFEVYEIDIHNPFLTLF